MLKCNNKTLQSSDNIFKRGNIRGNSKKTY